MLTHFHLIANNMQSMSKNITFSMNFSNIISILSAKCTKRTKRKGKRGHYIQYIVSKTHYPQYNLFICEGQREDGKWSKKAWIIQ